MRYKGKIYAIKTIHPYFNREDATRRKRTGSFGNLFRNVEGEKEVKPSSDDPKVMRDSKGKEKEGTSPTKDAGLKGEGKNNSFVNGLEYMKRIEQLSVESNDAKKDDFWKWLYSQLGEYISMLVLPREGFVKLYYCYVGKRPAPPRYYCPNCFQNKYEEELVFEEIKEERIEEEGPTSPVMTSSDGGTESATSNNSGGVSNNGGQEPAKKKKKKKNKNKKNNGARRKKAVCNYCGSTLNETFYGEDSLHLVLEYCAEGSLEKYIEKKILPSPESAHAYEGRRKSFTNSTDYDPECVHLGASLPEDKIVSFLCQILSALAYHHARGVVHEDLKPANIMMRDENTLCLGDFGLASFTKKGTESHGSPDYNPPEINNRGALPVNYDSAKADVWAVGCIALEMFGFQIPVKNIPKALAYLADHCSPLLAKAISMMLEVDYNNRGSALFCLIQIENFKEGLERDMGHSTGDISHAIEHMDDEALGIMADVMERYQLLDDVDQTIPLIGKKTHCVFRDYTQGAVVCCRFYLSLMESQSPKIITMSCTHLARLISNERLRPLILELDVIKRLSTLLFQMGITEKLQLLIVDTFAVLTEITPMGGSVTALTQILSLNVLPSLIGLLVQSKSSLLRTAILVVFENCFHIGIPLEYYRAELNDTLWGLVMYSSSLSDKAFALKILKAAVLAFPSLRYEKYILMLRDISTASNEALQRMKDFAKLRKKGFNATPIYLYLMMVTQFAKRKQKVADNCMNDMKAQAIKELEEKDKNERRMEEAQEKAKEKLKPSETNEREPSEDSTKEEASPPTTNNQETQDATETGKNKEEETKELVVESIGQEKEPQAEDQEAKKDDVAERQTELFIKSARVQKVMGDVYIHMVAKSHKFRELKMVLKSIMSSCTAIEALYSKAEFPVKCSGCGGAIVGTLYHCMACACVYFCQDCYQKGPDSLPKQFYFKHSVREHTRHMVVHKIKRNTYVLAQLRDGLPFVLMKPSFMRAKDFIKSSPCPLCLTPRAYYWDACNRAFCTKCGFIFCRQCNAPYSEWERGQDGSSPLSALQYLVKNEERIGIDRFLDESHYDLMMDLLFRYAQLVAIMSAGPETAGLYPVVAEQRHDESQESDGDHHHQHATPGDGDCRHPIFQSSKIFTIPTRCGICLKQTDATEVGIVEGTCGHRFCGECLTYQAVKNISIGRLHQFPNSFYGLKCPVKNCGNGLISDPHRIKSIVNKDFYELFLCVAFYLSQNQNLRYGKCRSCGRKCVLDFDGKLHCYKCSLQALSTPKRLKKQGWLTKKSSGVIATWQRRYFCVDETGLLSYTAQPLAPTSMTEGAGSPKEKDKEREKASSSSSSPKGRKKVMNLLTDMQSTSDDKNEDKKYRFSILSRKFEEPYELYADTLQEKAEWLEAIASWAKKVA